MPDKLYYAKHHGTFVKASHSDVPAFTKLIAQDFCHKELPELGTGKGIKVVLVDAGVADHPYLKTVISAANVGPSESTLDYTGHAHVSAGIIAANDEGSLVGLAPEAFICFAKATTDKGVMDSTSLAASLLWAIAVGAHVVVVGAVVTEVSPVLESAIEKAVASNVLIVMDGTVGATSFPAGVISTAGIKLPEKGIISTFQEDAFAEVEAGDFTPAIVGGIAALLVERAKSADKKSKASTMAKQIMALLKV